ncbi:MAG TPA: hypothetical protein VKW09_14690 [bacterium]|nr:hypothetical protein [bacterium]
MGENRDGTPGPPPPGRRCVHPQRRLAGAIVPYLRELDDHEWTAEEWGFLESATRWKGQALTEAEKRLWVAQARTIGDL